MTQLDVTIFQNFCLLSQEIQKFQKKVDSDPVTQENHLNLHKELEGIHRSLDLLRKETHEINGQARTQFSQLEEMEKQVVSLYRGIEEKFEQHEISLISKEALSLCSSLENETMELAAKKADALKQNILFLFKHRRPSLQNRKVIHIALQIIDHAKNGDVTGKEYLQLVQLLRSLLQESLAKVKMMADPMEAELVMEIYEVADLLHNKDKEALYRLNFLLPQLTEEQQNRLNAASSKEEQVQILLEIADGDPCFGWESIPAKQESVIHVLRA